MVLRRFRRNVCRCNPGNKGVVLYVVFMPAIMPYQPHYYRVFLMEKALKLVPFRSDTIAFRALLISPIILSLCVCGVGFTDQPLAINVANLTAISSLNLDDNYNRLATDLM